MIFKCNPFRVSEDEAAELGKNLNLALFAWTSTTPNRRMPKSVSIIPAGLSSAEERWVGSELGHSECISLRGSSPGPALQDRDKGINQIAPSHSQCNPQQKAFLSVCTSPGGPVLLSFLLKWEQLAASNLNLCALLLGELELETLAKNRWYGSEVGATFSPLSTLPCFLQVRDPLDSSSRTNHPALLSLICVEGSVGHS